MATQAEQAEHFLTLHHGTVPLLLPNAWDTALGAGVEAAAEFRDSGTFGYLDGARVGATSVRSTFGPP